MGLPYNPQGQGIVERANKTLKETLQKQRRGIAENASPKERVSLALFTLNFLIADDQGRSAAARHESHNLPSSRQQVMWKNVLDNVWHGPDPVLRRSRGAACVFPQYQEEPIWVPARLTRVVLPEEEKEGLEEREKGALVASKNEEDPKEQSNPLILQLLTWMMVWSLVIGEPRWGIMSNFPLPMPVMHDAHALPRFFATNRSLGLAYLPLDEQIHERGNNRSFLLKGSLCFVIVSTLNDTSNCILLYNQQHG